MYKKKRKTLIIVLVMFIISILFILLGLFFSKDNDSNIFKSILKDMGLSISNLVTDIFNERENDICDDSVNKELQYQLDILKETLELNNTLNESVKTNAIIINRNLDFWYDNITLNKGTRDGVDVGDPVVVKGGLVGKIISVSNYNSVARLLTSETINKISVKIDVSGDYVYGLLTNYDEKKNIYNLEGVSETVKINIESEVSTTGIGDNFPSGIIIGKVKNITTDSYDLAKLIEVEPSVNFDDLSVVTILSRKVK